ncbi:MAG: hypothetical protein K8L99_12035 [Anaerolineae bacterium]|nr:hypothetical protein [Anaerolineae bacterium]
MIESSKLLCLILVPVFFLVSCTNPIIEPPLDTTIEAMYSNPISFPDFVDGIEPPQNDALSLSQQICIFVSQAALWEPDNTASDLQSHILGNTYFLIDGSRAQPEYASIPSGFALDENGKATDKYYLPIEFCITPQVGLGFHTVEIVTSSISNQQVSYTWAIKIDK